ncbi:hypothetical protein ES703_50468 [subsurface metagenome]
MGIISDLGRSTRDDTKRMYAEGKTYNQIARILTKKYDSYITLKMVKNFLEKGKIILKKVNLKISCPKCQYNFPLEKIEEIKRILNRQEVEK